jgi:hypothetical protein
MKKILKPVSDDNLKIFLPFSFPAGDISRNLPLHKIPLTIL